MTVAARTAEQRAATASGAPSVRAVDFGSVLSCRAGTYAFDGVDLDSGWHSHDLHQLEYAVQGSVEVETAGARHLLPPQQAIWIPAGLPHRTTLRRVRTVSVFFGPEMVPGASDRARVLPAAPVVREMILHGARWPVGREASDPTADAFFRALALLVTELIEHELPLWLPTSDDPHVDAAMRHTSAHLASVTVGAVARAVGWSERTLRRRFAEDTGMTWRQYILHARLLRAMAMLAEPQPSVLDVATAVGFGSAGAFARAFRAAVGETPSAYRRRSLGEQVSTTP